MELVFLTALGIGGATVAGALLGFVFKNISHRFSDLVLSFAAGVMLCAAIIGLILPSIEYGGGKDGLWMTIIGILCGALSLNVLDKLTPHLHSMAGVEHEAHPENTKRLNKVLLFVMAIGAMFHPAFITAAPFVVLAKKMDRKKALMIVSPASRPSCLAAPPRFISTHSSAASRT